MTRRDEPSRSIGLPQAGYYKIKRVHRGPWVAASITHAIDGWRCFIDGKCTTHFGRAMHDPAEVPDLYRVYGYGVVISEAEHTALVRNPHPSPGKAINLNMEPPIRF